MHEYTTGNGGRVMPRKINWPEKQERCDTLEAMGQALCMARVPLEEVKVQHKPDVGYYAIPRASMSVCWDKGIGYHVIFGDSVRHIVETETIRNLCEAHGFTFTFVNKEKEK